MEDYRTDDIKAILMREMKGYNKGSPHGCDYFTLNPEGDAFIVAGVSISLLVCWVDSMIWIDEDMNDKPLVDALVQAGVPRERIVLAYAGESTGEPSLLWQ